MWACNADVVPSDLSYFIASPLVKHEESWKHSSPLQTTPRMLQQRCHVAHQHYCTFALFAQASDCWQQTQNRMYHFTILYKNPLPSTWKTKPCSFGRMSKRRMVLTGFGSGFPKLAKWVKSCWPMKRSAACLQGRNTPSHKGR